MTDGDSLIQPPSFGVGNGLDCASGKATKNTDTPHSSPAVRTAKLEMRSDDDRGE